MLLGIPGDNTFSNYQEANRTFWRQTVLPLVQRTTAALGEWLGPGYGANLRLKADTEGIDALSSERDAQWSRLDKSTFLTINEKRIAAGYGPVAGGDGIASPAQPSSVKEVALDCKYPGQPRTPNGMFDFGQQDGDVVPVAGKRPSIPTIAPTSPKSGTKTQKSGLSGAEAARDVPSWAKGERPLVGEDGKAFAKRLLDAKYGEGKWDPGPTSEFNRIQKFGDRAFE